MFVIVDNESKKFASRNLVFCKLSSLLNPHHICRCPYPAGHFTFTLHFPLSLFYFTFTHHVCTCFFPSPAGISLSVFNFNFHFSLLFSTFVFSFTFHFHFYSPYLLLSLSSRPFLWRLELITAEIASSDSWQYWLLCFTWSQQRLGCFWSFCVNIFASLRHISENLQQDNVQLFISVTFTTWYFFLETSSLVGVL